MACFLEATAGSLVRGGRPVRRKPLPLARRSLGSRPADRPGSERHCDGASRHGNRELLDPRWARAWTWMVRRGAEFARGGLLHGSLCAVRALRVWIATLRYLSLIGHDPTYHSTFRTYHSQVDPTYHSSCSELRFSFGTVEKSWICS